MAHLRVAGCDFSTPPFAEASVETQDFVSPKHPPQPPPPYSDAAAAFFAGRAFEADGSRDSVVPFLQTTMPLEWPQHIAAASPEHLRQTMAPDQYWSQQLSLGAASIGMDSLSPGLSPLAAVPWAQPDGLPAVCGSSTQLNHATNYPLTPLVVDPTPSLHPYAPPQLRGPIQIPEHGLPPTGEYESVISRKRRRRPHADAAEGTGKRKRGRSPIPARDPNADLPRCLPSRRTSISDPGSHFPSPAHSATGSSFAAADDAGYYRLSGSSLADSDDNCDEDDAEDGDHQHHNPQPGPNHTATTAATTATTTGTGTHAHTSDRNRDRNRAAASRYRAKTQAASARLEAAERAASARHAALAARAGQLRDEVFALKSELLRHAGAGCGCPLIRGYLERAAVRAWRGGVIGGGGGGGCEGKEGGGKGEAWG
ncbi:7d4e337b-88b8-4f83-85f3-5c4583de4e3a [Thermothielavioides terrestris]|uniref:7d4e337b-88b8-4f83-85f3-5c4583de4e3a n=1 Tax=Thermothielavioides terrestris TaxID=2587410 RepID=A0A446B791_9PEZI|nr:7d4e337b-88b8-4f83-85f3-5c4583de4e3a [Thermothielavioides terrestris]